MINELQGLLKKNVLLVLRPTSISLDWAVPPFPFTGCVASVEVLQSCISLKTINSRRPLVLAIQLVHSGTKSNAPSGGTPFVDQISDHVKNSTPHPTPRSTILYTKEFSVNNSTPPIWDSNELQLLKKRLHSSCKQLYDCYIVTCRELVFWKCSVIHFISHTHKIIKKKKKN